MILRMDCVIVSHTHWDREWYRTFQAFRARLVDTVDAVLDQLDRDPGWRRIRGSVTRADACWAAAALETFAEMARITARASAMNGGSTQSTRIHQLGVGKNQPPTFGPTVRFTTSE